MPHPGHLVGNPINDTLRRSSGTLRAIASLAPDVPLERYFSFRSFFNPRAVPDGTIIFNNVSNSPELMENKKANILV